MNKRSGVFEITSAFSYIVEQPAEPLKECQSSQRAVAQIIRGYYNMRNAIYIHTVYVFMHVFVCLFLFVYVVSLLSVEYSYQCSRCLSSFTFTLLLFSNSVITEVWKIYLIVVCGFSTSSSPFKVPTCAYMYVSEYEPLSRLLQI